MNIKRFFQMLPRPVKACLYVALVCVLALMFYMAIRCIPLTLRQDFRRAERANLVGPSKIVDQFKPRELEEQASYIIKSDDVIIGETDYGICLFHRFEYDSHSELGGSPLAKQISASTKIVEYHSDFSVYGREFYYIEKSGNITVVTIPTSSYWGYSSPPTYSIGLPLYIFTEHKDATRAQITLTITGQAKYSDQTVDFSEVFTAEATAIDAGVLRCFLKSSGGSSTVALDQLPWLSYLSYFANTQEYSVPCTVALYDTDGKLIAQEEIDLFSNREK